MKPTYLIALVLAAGLVAACEKEAPKTPPAAPKVSAPAPATTTPAPAPAAATPAPTPAAEPKKDEAKK